MPSGKDCAERLREQAYKTLLPQIRDLEEELKAFGSSLSAGVHQIERRIEALRQIELPTTELILDEILGEIVRHKDLETSLLARFSCNVCKKETQEEILTFLLDEARQFSPRLALFAARGDRLVGWSSRGCSDALAQTIGTASFLRSECSQLADALNGESVVTVSNLPDRGCLQSLQEAGQGPWRLFPLRVLQRPAALLLAGETEEIACRPDALSLLVDCTALRLENVALKILYKLMAANPESTNQQALTEKTAAAEPVAAPKLPTEIPAPSMPTIIEEEPVQEPVPSFEMAGEGFNSRAGAQTQITITSTTHPEIHKAAQQESQPVSGDETLYAEAKRFARLLVSEIKLYNEHHVVEGRQNQDLYLRLKKDIDRSREMYEKRVSPNVTRKIDYFHDEIIRILGDNDPSALGSDYPGPRVES
jgi:hypothetical protein